MRMDLGEEARRHEERRGLVLDEIGHDLDHGLFDLSRVIDLGLPIDRGPGIPLRRCRLGVDARRVVGPHLVLGGEREMEARAPGLHPCSSPGEPPRLRRRVDD